MALKFCYKMLFENTTQSLLIPQLLLNEDTDILWWWWWWSLKSTLWMLDLCPQRFVLHKTWHFVEEQNYIGLKKQITFMYFVSLFNRLYLEKNRQNFEKSRSFPFQYFKNENLYGPLFSFKKFVCCKYDNNFRGNCCTTPSHN